MGIALLAVPMALDCIAFMSFSIFLSWALLFGGILCGISVFIDYLFYNKLLLAPLNIFLYNLSIFKNDDDEQLDGQNLYGVDDWKYYAKNLTFNWNIAYLLAMAAPFACNIFVLMIWNKKKKSKNRGRAARGTRCCSKYLNLFRIGGDSNSAIVGRLIHCMLPFWIWYLFFMQMPHKEERFMFVIYPFIALNAALTLTQFRMIRISENGKIFGFDVYKVNFIKIVIGNINFGVIAVFVMLCLSRTIGQIIYYRAPLDIWYKTGEYIRMHDGMSNICVGKEWYRIPSSLFVSDVGKIKWIRSGFDGELPAEFEGTDFVNQPFNDKNKMEESRFVDVKVCDYIVDLWESNKVINGYDVANYEVIEKVKFLDRGMTSGIFRSFYVPILSDRNAVYANYVLLKKKESEK